MFQQSAPKTISVSEGLKLRVSLLALFFCLALNFIPTVTAAEAAPKQYSLQGRVTDAYSKSGIASVKISAVDKAGQAVGNVTTDSNGYYKFPGPFSDRPNTFKFTFSAPGYYPNAMGGNISSTAQGAYTINFLLYSPHDTTPPKGSITINNNAAYTASKTVTLSLSVSDDRLGVANAGIMMRLCNAGSAWSPAHRFASSLNWVLPSGDGEKTVNVQFMDAAGNWSQPVSSSITLDTIPPVIVITSPQEGFIAGDSNIQLQGTVDGVSFSETRTLTEGQNTLTKTAQDRAGNSSSSSVTVNLYPGTLIGPEGGEVFSPDGKVKLTIPPGALSAPQQIRILNVDKQSLANLAPEGKTLLRAVECKSDKSGDFLLPLTITYFLDEAQIPGTAISLGLYENGKIYLTSDPSVIPVDGYTATFHIQHFSTYTALASLTPQSTPIGSGVKIPLPDLLTGSFSSSIPITIPPGRKGMQPQLSLNYRSSNPNSWVGMGFSLNPGYIVRSTRLGPPSYNDTQDTFYLITDAGTTELVHLIDNLYQAKVESSFTKFFKEFNDSWKAVAKDGSVLQFGQDPDSKEISSKGTFSWHLTKAVDTNGNYIQFRYAKDQGKTYLSRIDYTGNDVGLSPTNSIEFVLEPGQRDDIISSYISTSKITTAKRLKEIKVSQGYDLVWRYALEYGYSSDTNRSLLKSITQYGSDGKSLPKQEFTYQEAR